MTQKQIHRIAMVLKSHGKGHRGLLGEKSLKNSRGVNTVKRIEKHWSDLYTTSYEKATITWSDRHVT